MKKVRNVAENRLDFERDLKNSSTHRQNQIKMASMVETTLQNVVKAVQNGLV